MDPENPSLGLKVKNKCRWCLGNPHIRTAWSAIIVIDAIFFAAFFFAAVYEVMKVVIF